MTDSTLRSVYKDLVNIFNLQFEDFVKQFLASDIDLDAFFEDAETHYDSLNNVINSWCENENPTHEDNIKAAAAIFMMSFIDKVDKATAIEAQGEESENKGPLD